jgi:type III pantothenate kinase
MILAIDIGNSNIVFGGVEGDEILFEARIRTESTKTSDEYCVDLKIILDVYKVSADSIEGSIISSVVPQVLNSVKTALLKLTGKTPLVVGPGLKTGLKIMIDNPAQLGSDRVADAVAAVSEYPCPLITIDMGTATTISVIDKNQNFIGGVIMPGLRISAESLSSRTSQLPQISLDPPKKAIGRNTIDCMRSGIVLGCAATIDGIVEKIEQELGYSCTVVSTGGHANIVIPYCKRQIIVDEKLLLKGLMILYRKNA